MPQAPGLRQNIGGGDSTFQKAINCARWDVVGGQRMTSPEQIIKGSLVVEVDSVFWQGSHREASSQFCCKMRFSSSSAERRRKAADSRYPAISCRTALISVGLSWAAGTPLFVLLAGVGVLDVPLFMLRSVGPASREQEFGQETFVLP